VLVTQSVVENTFIAEESTILLYQHSANVTYYCMQLIMVNVYIFKSVPIPAAGSFTVIACILNVAINTAEPS
jgi:hypothetical protein